MDLLYLLVMLLVLLVIMVLPQVIARRDSAGRERTPERKARETWMGASYDGYVPFGSAEELPSPRDRLRSPPDDRT